MKVNGETRNPTTQVSRLTASKYLQKAEELGYVELVYERKDTKIYAPKALIDNRRREKSL